MMRNLVPGQFGIHLVTKKSEEKYINVKISGICTYWDSDGRKFNEKHYHDDVMTNIVYFKR